MHHAKQRDCHGAADGACVTESKHLPPRAGEIWCGSECEERVKTGNVGMQEELASFELGGADGTVGPLWG
eukprot:365126-Chlamydomonas_euryale.AAC.7